MVVESRELESEDSERLGFAIRRKAATVECGQKGVEEKKR
jgi:hypothetical protein